MNKLNTEKEFSLIKRAKSFTHAGRGLRIFLKTTHNARVQVVIMALVAGLGVYLDITRLDWLMLIIASALVLMAEAFNTAIEIDIDLTSPEYHPYARDTKDVAAGAVLIAALAAALIGLIVFIPYLF
jgi:diacylglycerol kinase (ATP)